MLEDTNDIALSGGCSLPIGISPVPVRAPADLLTLRAHLLLGEADVMVHDRACQRRSS